MAYFLVVLAYLIAGTLVARWVYPEQETDHPEGVVVFVVCWPGCLAILATAAALGPIGTAVSWLGRTITRRPQ